MKHELKMLWCGDKVQFQLDMALLAFPLGLLLYAAFIYAFQVMVPMGNPASGQPGPGFFTGLIPLNFVISLMVPIGWLKVNAKRALPEMKAVPMKWHMLAFLGATLVHIGIIGGLTFLTFPLPLSLFYVVVTSAILHEQVFYLPLLRRWNPQLDEDPVQRELLQRQIVIMPGSILPPGFLLIAVTCLIKAMPSGTLTKSVLQAALPIAGLAAPAVSGKIITYLTGNFVDTVFSKVAMGMLYTFLRMCVQRDGDLSTAIYFTAFEACTNLFSCSCLILKTTPGKLMMQLRGQIPSQDDEELFEAQLGIKLVVLLAHEIVELSVTPLRFIQVLVGFALSPNKTFMVGYGVKAYGAPSKQPDGAVEQLFKVTLLSWCGDLVVSVLCLMLLKQFLPRVSLLASCKWMVHNYGFSIVCVSGAIMGFVPVYLDFLHFGSDLTLEFFDCTNPDPDSPICPSSLG